MVVVVAHLLAGETTPSVHLLALNSRLWLHVAGLCSAATPRATASTGGLNQVRVSVGLFGHMRIHESDTDRTPDTPTTSNTTTVHTPTLASSPCATTTTTTTTTTTSSVADTDTADFLCPHCPRTFTSRIGLIGHLRIHRTETGEPVPGAPTDTHQARLNCQHCLRTFRHRMGLFGHMRIHDNLR
nr:unnamed protein product [Spirometra erinaceieuropaei]